MPTFTTDIAAAQQSYRGASARPDGGKVTGAISYLEAVYTTTGAEAASDIIDIGVLPEGVVVIPERSSIAMEACAANGTGAAIATLGDAVDADRYSATSVSITAASVIAVTSNVAAGSIVRTPVTVDTNTIKATIALSSGAITAAKKIAFLIAFRKP